MALLGRNGALMPQRLVGITFSLDGYIREDKETNAFVSYCPALDLYSAGKTRIDAKNALKSAVTMFVKLGFERQILGKLLHERGFMAADDGPQRTDSESVSAENFIAVDVAGHNAEYDDTFPVEVPLHLVAQKQMAVI